MDTFALVYLISTIAEADGLGRAECPAYLAAYAHFTNVVNLCSLGSDAGFGCLGFGVFFRSH